MQKLKTRLTYPPTLIHPTQCTLPTPHPPHTYTYISHPSRPPHPLLEFSKPRWLVCRLQTRPCISSSVASSCRFYRARIGATIQLGRELGCRLLLWLSWIILCTFSPALGCPGHPSNHLKRSRLQGQGHKVNTKVAHSVVFSTYAVGWAFDGGWLLRVLGLRNSCSPGNLGCDYFKNISSTFDTYQPR